MERPSDRYVISFQAEPFRHGMRYHWMVCRAENTDELISWGYAATPELAEAAAGTEVADLCSGLSQGGLVIGMGQELPHRRYWQR